MSFMENAITQTSRIENIAHEYNISVFMLMSSGLAAIGLNWVHSLTQNLILSCIFEAIISCTEAVLFCVIVEIFPSHLGSVSSFSFNNKNIFHEELSFMN